MTRDDRPTRLGVLDGGDEGDDGQVVEPLIRPAEYSVVEGLPCRHRQADVSERKRTVICRDCGVALDPIAFLSQIAQEYGVQVSAREGARREAERARQELQDLKREVKRLQASRGRERKKQLAALQWDGDTIDLPLTLQDIKRLWSGIARLEKLSEYRHLAALLRRAAELHPKVQEARRADPS